MDTNMTGFRCFFCILVLWTKVILALEGLKESFSAEITQRCYIKCYIEADWFKRFSNH